MTISRGRAPNWKIKNAVNFAGHTLEAGSFVRPIEFKFLPSETKKELGINSWFDHKESVACYTALGFIIISRKNLEESW